MSKYNSVAEITNAFLKDGWKNISFSEVLENGKKLYKMDQTGNLYDDRGKIYRYNLKIKTN